MTYDFPSHCIVVDIFLVYTETHAKKIQNSCNIIALFSLECT